MNVTLYSQVSAQALANTGNTSTSTYRPQAPARSAGEIGSEYKQDIAGKVMDNEAYGHGLTAEDIMQQAANTDVSVQKDFMIVMSNCVSGEDYQRMQEEGFNPASTDVETYVNSMDRIKVALAEAGVEIIGYNDNLDVEKIAEITGSRIDAELLASDLLKMFSESDMPATEENVEAAAGAVAQGSKITEISDEAVKYMVLNCKEPTIANVYKAQFLGNGSMKQAQGYYSENIAGSSYYAKKADSINWNNLEKQLAAVVKQAGLDESAIDDAKWLVESGIELNAENLVLVSDLRDLSSKLPMEQQALEQLCVAAMGNGKQPTDALLTGEEPIADKAKEILKAVESISDEAVKKTVESGEPINIKNLSKAQEPKDDMPVNENYGKASLKEIEAKRQLEEIRLIMSEEANRHLLKKGISIDTAKLSEVVEALKKTQEEIKASLFKGESLEENNKRALIFEETLTKTKELREMPAALVGKLVMSRQPYTLNRLYDEGAELQKELNSEISADGNAEIAAKSNTEINAENDSRNLSQNQQNKQNQQKQASQAYETLMTAPRKDLGDRISKAFRNVDDILQDMKLETSDANRRAVRILGYNSMEITKENIENVKHEDSKINSVISKMTPATTLQMIREQKNPLDMTMDELENYLNEKERSFGESAEKYSVFLQKLDRAGGISPEEREAYIGIYRLFNQIEKTDGAVVGSIVASGAQMNFKNMLSAIRTSSNRNMDVYVDDGFGALSELIKKGKAIDEQIMSGFNQESFDNSGQRNKEQYYAKLSGEINTKLSKTVDVEKLKDVDIAEDTTIEKFADSINMAQMAESPAQQEQWKKESLKNFQENLKKAQQIEERVIEALIDYGQTISVDNIYAAQTLMLDRGSLFKQIIKESDSEESDDEAADETADSEDAGIFETDLIEKSILAKAEQFSRQLTDRESAAVSYADIINGAKKAVERLGFKDGASHIDVKAAQSLYKGLSLAGSLAQEENYEVPMNIKGEITSVNLKIYHNATSNASNACVGKVAITFETELLGKVAAEFDVNDKSIKGMVVYENKSSKADMKKIEEAITNELSNGAGSSDGAKNNICVSLVQSNSLDLGRFGMDRAQAESGERPSTAALYRVAKAFLTALWDIKKGTGI